VDAYISDADFGERVRFLDVAASGDESAERFAYAAVDEWSAGRVLCVFPYESRFVEALVVPAMALTTELIEEALSRYADTLDDSPSM
jgi:hypothetical protein